MVVISWLEPQRKPTKRMNNFATLQRQLTVRSAIALKRRYYARSTRTPRRYRACAANWIVVDFKHKQTAISLTSRKKNIHQVCLLCQMHWCTVDAEANANKNPAPNGERNINQHCDKAYQSKKWKTIVLINRLYNINFNVSSRIEQDPRANNRALKYFRGIVPKLRVKETWFFLLRNNKKKKSFTHLM